MGLGTPIYGNYHVPQMLEHARDVVTLPAAVTLNPKPKPYQVAPPKTYCRPPSHSAISSLLGLARKLEGFRVLGFRVHRVLWRWVEGPGFHCGSGKVYRI